MEWTKESLLNTCIVMKSVAHAVRIVKFYKSFGFMENVKLSDVKNHYTKQDVSIYIGIDSTQDTKKCHGWWPHILPRYIKEIKLPSGETKPRRKFPREMMVSDDKITWYKRAVVANTKSIKQYIALKAPYNINDIPIGNQYKGWKHAKEID